MPIKSKYIPYVLAATLVSSNTSLAQEVGETTFGIGLTSVGLSADVRYQVSDKWRIRGMLTAAPTFDNSQSAGGISYAATTDVYGLSLLADYQLGESIFRVTAGAFISNSIVMGKANGNLQIGDNVYASSIKTEVGFANSVAPIIGIGFDYPLSNRWVFAGTGGYMFTNGVNADIKVTGGSSVNPEDIKKEQAQIETGAPTGYPFLEMGLVFRF